jgi:hypothetical protein
LELAGAWCEGQIIDAAPALAHAVRVALKLGEHIPDVAPELVAAVLVHDNPEFAPPSIDLDAVLTARLDADVTRVVRALQREHEALDSPTPQAPTGDLWTLYASAADKIVSLRSILTRAAAANDPDEFWQAQQPFVDLVPYFRAFHTSASPLLPETMGDELGRLVGMAEHATDRPSARCRAPSP